MVSLIGLRQRLDGSGVVKGRMKFCRPIFAATGEVNHALAKKTFEKNQPSFHPIAQKLIAKVSWRVA